GRRLEKRVPARRRRAEGRRFGLPVGGMFLVLGAVLWWRGHATAPVPAALGALLVVAALVAPTRLGPFEHGWMRLGAALSRITTPIVLAIAYFGVIAPIGVMLRLAGRNPIGRPRPHPRRRLPREAGAP